MTVDYGLGRLLLLLLKLVVDCEECQCVVIRLVDVLVLVYLRHLLKERLLVLGAILLFRNLIVRVTREAKACTCIRILYAVINVTSTMLPRLWWVVIRIGVLRWYLIVLLLILVQ